MPGRVLLVLEGLLQFESKDSHLSDIGNSMPVNQVDCGEWMYCGKSIPSGIPLIDYPPACLIILWKWDRTSEVFLICQLVEDCDGDFSCEGPCKAGCHHSFLTWGIGIHRDMHKCFHNHHLTWFTRALRNSPGACMGLSVATPLWALPQKYHHIC